VPGGLKDVAKRVKTLSEFERAGPARSQRNESEPDSDAEDSAVLDGIEGQMTNTQEKFYFGLRRDASRPEGGPAGAGPDRSNCSSTKSRAQSRGVASLTKPVVGIMSGLAGARAPPEPDDQAAADEAWALETELQNMSTVKKNRSLSGQDTDDIKVCWVTTSADISRRQSTRSKPVHPARRQADRVPRFAFKPYLDQQTDCRISSAANNALSIRLFHRLQKQWGYGWKCKVVADLTYAAVPRPRIFADAPSLNRRSAEQDDVVARPGGTLLLPVCEQPHGKPAEGTSRKQCSCSRRRMQWLGWISSSRRCRANRSYARFQPAVAPYPWRSRVSGSSKRPSPKATEGIRAPSKDPKRPTRRRTSQGRGPVDRVRSRKTRW